MTTARRLGAPFLVAAVLLGGCAAFRGSDEPTTEQLLATAGFRVTTAETPAQLASLNSLPPRVLVSQPKDDHFVYSYADPDSCRCIYVGGPEEYSAYQRLSLEKRLEHERIIQEERRDP
jgi:hypothetical protein